MSFKKSSPWNISFHDPLVAIIIASGVDTGSLSCPEVACICSSLTNERRSMFMAGCAIPGMPGIPGMSCVDCAGGRGSEPELCARAGKVYVGMQNTNKNRAAFRAIVTPSAVSKLVKEELVESRFGACSGEHHPADSRRRERAQM